MNILNIFFLRFHHLSLKNWKAIQIQSDMTHFLGYFLLIINQEYLSKSIEYLLRKLHFYLMASRKLSSPSENTWQNLPSCSNIIRPGSFSRINFSEHKSARFIKIHWVFAEKITFLSYMLFSEKWVLDVDFNSLVNCIMSVAKTSSFQSVPRKTQSMCCRKHTI